MLFSCLRITPAIFSPNILLDTLTFLTTYSHIASGPHRPSDRSQSSLLEPSTREHADWRMSVRHSKTVKAKPRSTCKELLILRNNPLPVNQRNDKDRRPQNSCPNRPESLFQLTFQRNAYVVETASCWLNHNVLKRHSTAVPRGNKREEMLVSGAKQNPTK